MNTEYIIISEYCIHSQIEPDFILDLNEVGLIELLEQDNQLCIASSQLRDLERYTRWYYDLEINVEGIDVIQNLMNQIDDMKGEMSRLRELVRLMEG